MYFFYGIQKQDNQHGGPLMVSDHLHPWMRGALLTLKVKGKEGDISKGHDKGKGLVSSLSFTLRNT